MVIRDCLPRPLVSVILDQGASHQKELLLRESPPSREGKKRSIPRKVDPICVDTLRSSGSVDGRRLTLDP